MCSVFMFYVLGVGTFIRSFIHYPLLLLLDLPSKAFEFLVFVLKNIFFINGFDVNESLAN